MNLADIERAVAAQDAELRAAQRALVTRVGPGATLAIPQTSLERIADALHVISMRSLLGAIRC
jgi:hypothetical protein